MRLKNLACALAAFVGVCVLHLGCADRQASPVPGGGTAKSTGESSKQDEIAASLAKLSADDRKLAETQKTCPVSDEPLGSMGAPIKIALGEKAVFIFCTGCEEELTKNQDKYLAKLPK
jgi:hypothetical protein